MPDLNSQLRSAGWKADLLGGISSRMAVLHARRQLRRLKERGQLVVGRHTYGLPTIYVSHPADSVTIGSFCSIAPQVVLVPGGIHPVVAPSTFPFAARLAGAGDDPTVSRRGPITIGHDVWLGTGAMVLSGVTIGTGAIIGAGAIVSRDVPAYSIALGVPARVVGERLPTAVARRMLASEWWNLDDDFLLEKVHLLNAPDGCEEFLAALPTTSAPRA